MSGVTGATGCVAPGVTGVSLMTDPYLCTALDGARMKPLTGPTITPPTPITDTLLPTKLQQAITGCTGACRFIGYDFDSDVATKATSSRYVVDTYSTTAENSGVLVTKGTKTSGTISGIAQDPNTGGSTGTVTYTADDGQVYTFQGRWPSVLANGTTVPVYYDPTNKSKGALRPEDLGIGPPVLVEPPGYELPDFQATVVTAANNLGTPTVTSVEECAARCDTTTGCAGFNFGGIDTNTICELVSSTTTREYADNKSGFRKETISSTQTGDGSNPSGTDLSNEGIYCRDVQACNSDIERIITENVGASNPIATLSTSDIESCAYCPIRTYATSGNVTTNEIGVSKSNPTPAAAINELKYVADGTSATHLTLTTGIWYKFSLWKEHTPGGKLEFLASPISTNTPGIFKLLCLRGNKIFIPKNPNWRYPLTETIVDLSSTFGDSGDMSFTFQPVDYVTNGFILNDVNTGPFAVSFGDITYQVWATAGTSGSWIDMVQNNFWKLSRLTSGRLTTMYNKSIFVISEINPVQVLSILASNQQVITYQQNDGKTIYDVTYTNPLIYINDLDEKFKLESYNNQIIFRKFTEPVIFSWYLQANPSANGPFITPWKRVWYDASSPSPPLNKIPSDSQFWKLFQSGSDMPDPYAELGQFRTLDVKPPSTSQTWAYNRRQGCDKNCGNVTNGYAVYKCTAAGGGNCDPGKGAYVSGAVCDGTYTSCSPADDSADLKNEFSFKFRGLLPSSTKVVSGGSNSDHNTDGLRISTVYSLDSSFSVSTTPNESIQNLYTIFPSFVIDRILRTPNLASIVPPAMCSPGTYVKDYGYGIKACEICEGNPTLNNNEVFQPDTVNPGNFLCTIITCPTGQFRDLLTNRCAVPCQPGSYVATDGTCTPCPDQTLAGNQYWMPDLTRPGSYICTKNQCAGGLYVNSTKTGCATPCQAGYGPDPSDSSRCIACTVTPTQFQKWIWESLGPVGGQVVSFTCGLTTCPDGQYPSIASDIQCYPCSQPSDLPTDVTATFGQGCVVNGCTVAPNSTSVASATVVAPTVTPPANCTFNVLGLRSLQTCAPAGSCFPVCRPGFYGSSCTACSKPTGVIVTYSSGCTATACSVDTSVTATSGVSSVTLTNGSCDPSCSPGFAKIYDYSGNKWCSSCGRTVDDPMTTRVYAQNSCGAESCSVTGSLVGKATASIASFYNTAGRLVSACVASPSPGFTFDYSSPVTVTGEDGGDTFSRTTYSIIACPAGDSGTSYTYSVGCAMSTCTYTNPNDPNETAAQVNSKCTKVCKSGYTRDASGKCTVACPQPSDQGLTVTFGPYGCQVSTCTSSSGFPTLIDPYSTSCSINCPQGARQYTNTNVTPNRQDCAQCSSDLMLNPWIFSSTCSLMTQWCNSENGLIYQSNVWYPSVFLAYESTATASLSGSTCTTTCKTGYVKDRYGICRKCPGETPSSTSAVVNGVCVTTCKANHSRDETYDTKDSSGPGQQIYTTNGRTGPWGQLNVSHVFCPTCTNGTYWDAGTMQCLNCSTASTTSTQISALVGGGCQKFCKPAYYLNLQTGNCDTCTVGYYCPASTSTAQPIKCSAGYYCPAGSSSQTQCNVGYSCPAGSSSQTQCTLTPASGYIWANPRVDCTTRQCRAGYYCPDANTETMCRLNGGDYCPAGTVSATCPAGYYCAEYTSKVQCSVGYSCPAGSASQTSCGFTPANGNKWANPRVDCTTVACTTAGYYCTGGTESACNTTSCTSDKYESSSCTRSTNKVCTTCEAGSYCSGGVKKTCEAGYYCSGGTARTQCDVGYGCPAGSGSQTKCCVAQTSTSTNCSNTLNPGYIFTNPRVDCNYRQCNAGSYCPNSTTETACTTGNYCPAGSSSQTLCAAGSYCPDTTTQTQCSTGNYCPAGSTSQFACTGYYEGVSFGTGGNGYYCPNVTTRNTCSTCPSGQYASQTCTSTTDLTCNACANDGTVDCPGGRYNSCRINCDKSEIRTLAINAYNAKYNSLGYSMVTINRSVRIDSGNSCGTLYSCCGYAYTYKQNSTGVTYNDSKRWSFSNPFSSCTTSFAPVKAITTGSITM